jgi:hypothetical protein
MSWDMKHTGELELLWQRDINGELNEVQLNYMLNQYGIDKEEYNKYQFEKKVAIGKAVRMTMIKFVAVTIIGYFVLNAIL